MSKVLLYGPKITDTEMVNAYGGGTGGYTRNMITYLNYYKSSRHQQIPSFHTFRGQLKLDNFIWRFLIDSTRFLWDIFRNDIDVVHILGQYRTAIVREFMVCSIARLFRKKIVYELKAGAFINWFENTNVLSKFLTHFVFKSSSIILSEGKIYIPYVKDKFRSNIIYYPNYIPEEVIPVKAKTKLQGKELKILFVGYAYKGKGVYELIEGCNIAASKGAKLSLRIIGQEESIFSNWLDDFSRQENFTLIRDGKKPYSDVLESFKTHDIYCYPTKHSGEGHNNTINEAMMNGLIIITTKQGFLDTIITNDNGYSLEDIEPETIAKSILEINNNRDLAIAKGKKARQLLENEFNSNKLYPLLDKVYDSI
jgi:glycosyltransferase involved in cell wall biosynthesis